MIRGKKEIRAEGITSLGFGSGEGAVSVHSVADGSVANTYDRPVRVRLDSKDLVFLLTSVAERQPQVFLAIADALRAFPHTEPVKAGGYIPYALMNSLRDAAVKASGEST